MSYFFLIVFICLNVFYSGKIIIDELEMMKYFGVCFEIPVKLQPGREHNSKLFLFPSLGERGLND